MTPTLPAHLPPPTWHDSEYGIALYHGDCLEVLEKLPKVDAVVTDPPYGVMLGDVDNTRARKKNQQRYVSFTDSPEYVKEVCVPVIEKCRSISSRMVVTVGNRNMFLYPQPVDTGVWWNPAGCGIGLWGFSCVVTPIFYYGKDPKLGKGASPSSPTGCHEGRSEKIDHPCPKPIGIMKWLVNKGSLDGETVLDPFMGSGTTGVACVILGRAFIGIELEKKYFDIAVERIRKAITEYQGGPLFADHEPPALEQSDLFE